MHRANIAAPGWGQGTAAETLVVEIDARALQQLMAEGRLGAADFRCAHRADKARVKRWCLEHARAQLMPQPCAPWHKPHGPI
ncbi:hypothetical protein L1F30_13670 [Simiduia sp. 21SJ11W-1]|uniref:hypothetical protein n=1 Tax=Simiduia sp. 21SJ11W-1 TaxID=2909669 RepID=UPI00209EFDCB|nr:hypothetical protein [Simiduia sp. 21SJ11W-1]UTA47205.1 hypothetical protein L1F30_13670 [Simiduia sp. 21SJ11W-1]